MEESGSVVVDRIVQELMGKAMNSSTSRVTIQAGGAGLWLAVTLCACMAVANLFLVALYVDQGRRIDDNSHKLNAIYMMAPHLKPEDEKQ